MKPTYKWARATVDVQRKLTGDFRWSTSSQIYERGSRHVKRFLTRNQHHRLCHDMARAGMLHRMRNRRGTWEYAFSLPMDGFDYVLPTWKQNLKIIRSYRVDTSQNGQKVKE